MTAGAPNRATLWGRTLVEELAAAGVSGVCIAPGSRSTPLTVAFDSHPDVRVFSHLDERSAAFFALGRGKRTGEPTPVVCTSGTAAANFHPAVIEASEARVPLLVLTADRPPELGDSGANQTIDQEKLYGAAVRWYRDLPEPGVDDRALRALRTTAGRAVAAATGTPPGPVHLNCRFRKPLEPTAVPEDDPEGVPDGLAADTPLAARERDGPFVRVARGRPTLGSEQVERVADALDAGRGLLVAGPMEPHLAGGATAGADALAALGRATGFPILADPLSGLRFGSHVGSGPGETGEDPSAEPLICGGYDSYLDPRVTGAWPDPEVVLRVGASPTSKPLREYLRDADVRQFVVDPAGGWREATFTASDLLVAEPARLTRELADRLQSAGTLADDRWRERVAGAEARYWELVERAHGERFFEGTVFGDAAALAPDPSTLLVSNSMPVRDLDRFGRPRAAEVAALGNRGASGIDGVVSTALGAGSVTREPLVCVLGDLAYYHDMNGLLAIGRCGVDATIVLVNNDGGGIFHALPIADFDPPFTEQFLTPHGLDFASTGELYGLEFVRVAERGAFREAYRASIDSEGAQVVEVDCDAAASHAVRDELHERVCEELGD
jgi:2-succinyl-5-enolpyruvyl-6-hydroxy-3-cyclohexene-1-carboxylate synthase